MRVVAVVVMVGGAMDGSEAVSRCLCIQKFPHVAEVEGVGGRRNRWRGWLVRR